MALIWECWAVGLAASSSLSDTEAVIFHQEEVAAVFGTRLCGLFASGLGARDASVAVCGRGLKTLR
uniref:Uncharacterized protein n=1 Tax=Anguilla anguilla TaxID=7936 RepID=A0A0E9PSI8_ANGAN